MSLKEQERDVHNFVCLRKKKESWHAKEISARGISVPDAQLWLYVNVVCNSVRRMRASVIHFPLDRNGTPQQSYLPFFTLLYKGITEEYVWNDS